jgi:hypothetical protein
MLSDLIQTTGHDKHIMINSCHHQAPDRLRKGIRGTAIPEHGTIEAMEPAEGSVPGLTWEPPTHLLERDYRGKGGLAGDFLYCVKTRERPFRDVEYAHRVATVCHLGNIAYELKRPLQWDPVKEEFPGDDEANRMTWRPMREPWRL